MSRVLYRTVRESGLAKPASCYVALPNLCNPPNVLGQHPHCAGITYC